MMNRVILLVGALVLTSAAVAAAAEPVKLDGHTFTLPDGFQIELAAGPPLVERPITADFDELGRLYVTESSGSNDKVDVQLATKPHRVLRLEDSDGDGRFDKRTVFADQMMFPEGSLWYAGSLYVAAPPSIWKLTDADGDGVAESREEWFQGKTLTGCANDLHGPYLGLDGRIYWCKGAFAEQTYERPGKKPLVTRASHIFRSLPDGSQIESVMTGGMDNPVDVTFTPEGERVFTTTFLQHPGGGKRDGLLHAVYGGVYGKVHDVLEGHPRTGDVMPVLSHLGPAAPCGLTRLESNAFGAEYQDNLFATLFNLHKVTRHRLRGEGATFASEDHDFLVSDNIDFHPTDVIEDADGSLIVVNTGGWYKLCCPTSQLWKPDVLGAIYRVRRRNAEPVNDPRGLGLDWKQPKVSELARRIGDPRMAVQRRAMAELARRGADAVPALTGQAGQPARPWRLNAVWTLARIDAPRARAATRNYLADDDATVRKAALHSISLWRDPEAVESLIQRLNAGDPSEQRVAAEALGRLGDQRAVGPLLAAAKSAEDRFSEHSIRYALYELADIQALKTARTNSNSRVQRTALVVLDQLEGNQLDPRTFAPLLNSPDPLIRDTAAWIVGRHKDWGGPLADYLRTRLTAAQSTDSEAESLVSYLANFSRAPEIQGLLAEIVQSSRVAESARVIALKAMARATLKDRPPQWEQAIVTVLKSGDREALPAAVAAARALPGSKSPLPELTVQLSEIASRGGLADDLRLGALQALPAGQAVSPAAFEFLIGFLAPDVSVLLRGAAADVLAKANLTADQLRRLCPRLVEAGPLELPRLLAAYERNADPEVGGLLVASLSDAAALTSVRSETLRPLLTRYGPTINEPADALYRKLDVSMESQRARLDELLKGVKEGDIRRGQAVFHSQKAACYACHAMGYLGGNIGPDLTRIGQIRTERDLLEAIVFPSASFVRSFEPMRVETTDGKVLNGVVKGDNPEEMVLVLTTREEVRIPRNNIEVAEPSAVSIMPAGLDQQLTPQELVDLIAFLKAAK